MKLFSLYVKIYNLDILMVMKHIFWKLVHKTKANKNHNRNSNYNLINIIFHPNGLSCIL